ncbi:DEAD/DEAH box helicase [Gayadomonas joobiniege]|uniref:DEAD/DEAH box helicase n=1 Tax=Gayadomonas joobiniege TaxID=1234606 RepID=UPI0003630AAB|nr:DEAD/DEAH box helicase [Gayadomonas joobiniege]
MYQLRPYQQQAVDACIDHFKSSESSAVIVLPTGAGKSLVIAELARRARGRILVLTHVKELVAQNFEKYAHFSDNAGIYAAGLKQKNNQAQVTFASIQSVAPNLADFNQCYSLCIIDECHRISVQNGEHKSQYQKVLNKLKTLNPKLRVLGLTATPYRLGSGWIYRYHYYGFARSEQAAQFEKCIFEQPLAAMIKQNYLTAPKLVNAATEQYDFSSLPSNTFGEYPKQALNQLLSECPRVTEAICRQIVKLSQSRQGVMVFAATVEHAEEVYRYLSNAGMSAALITGGTEHTVRDQQIEAFKHKQLKFIVNVSVLTTGFDAPHVDFIAILRPTQSISLYQQIVGRGLRLAEGKKDCLIMDYAGNDFDIFYPEVGSPKPNKDTQPVQVECPECGFANIFWGKVDADGDLIEHYGRRCWGLINEDPPLQCSFRFKYKQCPECNQQNDIAARKCQHCRYILVDPDEQLKAALQLKDAKVLRVAGLTCEKNQHQIKLTYHGEDGETLNERFNLAYKKSREIFEQEFIGRCIRQPVDYNQLPCPDFVIARKQKNSGWQVRQRLFDYQGRFRKANQL